MNVTTCTHGYRGGELFQLWKKNKKKQKERKKSLSTLLEEKQKS